MRKYFFLLFCVIPVMLLGAPSYDQLYKNYFVLSSALAKDSVPEAKAAARELAKTADLLLESTSRQDKVITPKDLPQNEKNTVRESLETISALSKTIAEVDKLEQMRDKPFQEISALVTGLRVESKIKADEYYCPMVKKTWLQDPSSKGVQNPYLGKSMATCGEKKKG